MSAVNRGLRQATRSLRLHRSCQPSALRPLSSLKYAAAPISAACTRTGTRTSFSTMAALQSGAPAPAVAQSYDPEIVDIANYVHNKPIDSELAVSAPFFCPQLVCRLATPLTRPLPTV
jgi:2-methylcitrate dehydratase